MSEPQVLHVGCCVCWAWCWFGSKTGALTDLMPDTVALAAPAVILSTKLDTHIEIKTIVQLNSKLHNRRWKRQIKFIWNFAQYFNAPVPRQLLSVWSHVASSLQLYILFILFITLLLITNTSDDKNEISSQASQNRTGCKFTRKTE